MSADEQAVIETHYVLFTSFICLINVIYKGLQRVQFIKIP